MEVFGRVPKVGALGDAGAVAEAMDRYIAPAISAYTSSMAKMATSSKSNNI